MWYRDENGRLCRMAGQDKSNGGMRDWRSQCLTFMLLPMQDWNKLVQTYVEYWKVINYIQMEKDLCLVAVKGSESFYNKPVFVFLFVFPRKSLFKK